MHTILAEKLKRLRLACDAALSW